MKGTSMQDLNALTQLLGEKNVKKIKDQVTYELIENIKESIRSEWILPPHSIEEMIDELYDEVKDEILKEYRQELKNVMKEAFTNSFMKDLEEEDD